MKFARIRLFVHCFTVAIIFIIIYFINYFFTIENIPLTHIGWLSLVYLVFYIAVSSLFEFILKNSTVKRLIALGLYALLLLVLVDLVDLIIYTLLPALGVQLYDDSVVRNYNDFHYRIWRGFGFINIFAMGYIFIWTSFLRQKRKRNFYKSLRIHRERVIDEQYTSHFLKSVLVGSFGSMLLSDETKDIHIKSDIIQILGYILEIENLGKTDTLLTSVSVLNCFVRLLKRHYGEKSIEFEYVNDGSVYNDLPRGILIFPLENCIKHAKLSPDYPVKYTLTIADGILHVKCRSYIHHFKQKVISGIGNRLLKEKLINSVYIEEVNHRSDDTFYHFDLKLIPNYVKKTKIQFALFRR